MIDYIYMPMSSKVQLDGDNSTDKSLQERGDRVLMLLLTCAFGAMALMLLVGFLAVTAWFLMSIISIF
jgi:hypothetical protein